MKVAICTPSRDMVHASFAFDLANLVGYSVKKGIQIGVYNATGTLIADQRVNLAKEAIAAKVDYILWLDTDMRFPKNALECLLAHKKDLVGANYTTRSLPVEPVAFHFDDNVWTRVPTLPESKGLQEVSGSGFGVMLTSAKVFKAMPDPWFLIAYSTVNGVFHGEDLYFCMKAESIGFKTHIDHDLSKEVRHIGSFEFRHEHVDASEETA